MLACKKTTTKKKTTKKEKKKKERDWKDGKHFKCSFKLIFYGACFQSLKGKPS